MDDDPIEHSPSESSPGEASGPAPTPTPPAAGAIVFHSNIGCPHGYVAAEALLRARDTHGLGSTLAVVHRPLPRETIQFDEDAEDPWADAVERARAASPRLDWSDTGAPPRVSTRFAHEAVQAAKAVDAEASVTLDCALRRSYFLDHLDISDPALVLDLAVSETGLDRAALRREIESGRAGAEVRHLAARAHLERIAVSPSLVAFDGSTLVAPERADIEDMVLRSASAVAAE